VLVNGEKVKKNLKIEPKSEIFIEEIITSVAILAEDMALDIVYEDEKICIVNKNAGINVHPTPGIEWKSWTLVNGMLYHCKNKLPVISWEERPGIVHRLDKDTSGAIMIAKNNSMMHYLSDIIKERKIKKYYIAIVTWPINPKHAVTHGEILGYIDERYTVIRIDLETGRTHQIRVHLASIWYPIIGDHVYGNPRINKQAATLYQIHRQALHAYELCFDLYGENQSFIAPLKGDMQSILEGKISL